MSDTPKPKVATVSLAGCFGCHMSILDIDERILKLVELVEFDRSPIDDIKEIGPCTLGIIEGGVANSENLRTIQEFRKNCALLMSIGDCATTGGVPAMRNGISLRECFEEAYLHGVTVVDPKIPDDEELPTLLDKVYPAHEIVKIDYHLPGCPPSGDALWEAIVAILGGKSTLDLPYQLLKYD